MRMDQFPGLSESAKKFLAENQRSPKTCPTCGHVTETYVKKIGTFPGMFNVDYPLHRFPLKSGYYADEFLQVSPWSSGPVHFIGLRLTTLNRLPGPDEYVWTEEEMEAWL